MYAVQVEQGRERIRVRGISSGFLPSYRVKTASSDGTSVRNLVVPGYVFTLVKVRGAITVPDEEWEIIDKISDSRVSTMDKDGKFVSGPLMGLDQYIVQTGPDFVQLSVSLFGEMRRYRLPCTVAEENAEMKKDGEEVSEMAEPKTKTTYTEEQRAVMLRRAEEVGVRTAAEEFGVTWQVIAQMKRRAAEEANPEKKKASEKKRAEKKARKASEKKAGEKAESVKKKEKQEAVMTTAPERPTTELEIENAFLREQVAELTEKVEKLKKALADLL
jgi:hypothetical protein